MLDSKEIDDSADKDRYEKEYLQLRFELLEAQFDLIESKQCPVILLFSGMEGAGVRDTLTNTYKFLDARHVVTFAFDKPTKDQTKRPRMWRFWQALPPKGDIGVYAGSWYSAPFKKRVLNKINDAEFERQLEDIRRFEAMLVTEGAVILKFWMHLSKEDQKKRLKTLKGSKRTKWRVSNSRWGGAKHYDEVESVAEQMMRVTSSENSPWVPVNVADSDYRRLAFGRMILAAIRSGLERSEPAKAATPSTATRASNSKQGAVLDSLDSTLRLERADYKEQLSHYQDRLNKLVWSKKFKKRSLVLVFEGNDAAGKGGSIRRVIEFLDPRRYRVNQYAAPTVEESAYPYLWRFWRRIPKRGHIAIFDRSWYGRVLVERVEEFCSEADWKRAYGEINDFEKEVSEAGQIVIKFWLAIDKDEQERRFKEREETGYKRYKITDEDWRNRGKWDEYAEAAGEMIEKTSTSAAPWIVVEANDKYYARVKVLRSLCEQIEKSL